LLLLLLMAQGGPGNLTDVPGRVVVEPTYPLPFPEEFTLTFTDAQGRTTADILVSEKTKTTSFRSTRGGLSGQVRLLPDGTFNLKLPRGEHRLILRRSGASIGYFVKSIQAGSTNLLEKPLVAKASFVGELVITLAKCTSPAQDGCQ
jgi:hypothetical protein